MNCVDYSLNEIINGGDIPDYLLELAFCNPNGNILGNWYNQPTETTIQQGIREKVIYAVVLPRCNVQGGVTELLDLSGSRIEDLGAGQIGVNVPDFITGGRKIITVIEVYQGAMNSSSGMLYMLDGVGGCGQGTVNESLNSLISSLSGNRTIPQTYTNITMLGNNSFVINGAPSGMVSITANLILSYDEGLSTINPRLYDIFSELVSLATKAHIWKNCRYKVDESVTRGGVPVDAIKDDIASYQDSWKQYQDLFKEKWIKAMTQSDKRARYNSIRMRVPSRI